jgi:CTP synthase
VRARWPGIANASSTEFGPTDEPVVGLMTEWMSGNGLEKREAGGDLGGTMRLGAYPAKLNGNSVIAVDLRRSHRHLASATATATK